jgi:endonuclease-3
MTTTSPKPRESKPWRRPTRRRVLAIRDRLREMYGQPINEPNRRPIDELVLTILSQHTNDRNSGRAFAALKEAFPTWDEVRDAPVAEVEDAIRPGGLAQQKAPRIQTILRELGPEPDLDWTETAPLEESRAYLLSLPGVGRKTAACVLLFSWGLPDIPVDVHIHRVGGRLGLFPEKASLERAHDEMLAIVPSADVYEFHLNLIRHGRTICRRMCPWYRYLDHRDAVADD